MLLIGLIFFIYGTVGMQMMGRIAIQETTNTSNVIADFLPQKKKKKKIHETIFRNKENHIIKTFVNWVSWFIHIIYMDIGYMQLMGRIAIQETKNSPNVISADFLPEKKIRETIFHYTEYFII